MFKIRPGERMTKVSRFGFPRFPPVSPGNSSHHEHARIASHGTNTCRGTSWAASRDDDLFPWENVGMVVYHRKTIGKWENHRKTIGKWWIIIKPMENGMSHWIGLRENLQETMVFTIKYRAFL